MNKVDIKKISVTAMLIAVAFLCTFVFRFKVSFLTFDFKDAIISIVSLLYGPLYGVTSAGLVAFLEFISVSDTGVYGLIMNFLSSATFALTCGLVYKFKRSFAGAIIAVASSVITVTSVMMLANIFVTPYYMGVATDDVIKMLPTLLLPFNLSKALINSAAVLIIYKPITGSLKKIGIIKVTEQQKRSFSLRSIILMAISAVIIVLTVLFLILHLGGSFELLKANS